VTKWELAEWSSRVKAHFRRVDEMRLAKLENRAGSHDYGVIDEVELLAEYAAYGYSLGQQLLTNATTAGIQLSAMASLIDSRVAVLLESVSAPAMPRESLPASDMDSGIEEQRIKEFKAEIHDDLGRIRRIGDALEMLLRNVAPPGGARAQGQQQHIQSVIEKQFELFHSKLNEPDTALIAALGAAFVPGEWQGRRMWWKEPQSELRTLQIEYPTNVRVLVESGWVNSCLRSAYPTRY
jgi:hypothetical protein